MLVGLWGPYVPFDKRVTLGAQVRLSVCRPICGLIENSCHGVEHYAHMIGSMFYRKRAVWQLASTMGVVISKNTGSFIRIRPEELNALVEILVWGAQSGGRLSSLHLSV